MNDDAQAFEAHRSRLFGIAYRMLGTVSDAEDVLQDAFLRYSAAHASDIRSTEAFLTTIVTRLCLDRIKSAQHQREAYVGPWLPEPMLTDLPPEARDPAERAADLESISMAFLVLLQSLSPEERAAFLLHEVFDYRYGDIAAFVGKPESTCRQLVSRAKKHIADHRPRFHASPAEHRRVLTSFLQAAEGGDISALMKVMANDVALYSDGGGKATAATRPLFGPERVVKFIGGLPRLAKTEWRIDLAEVNGREGLVLREDGVITGVFSFEVGDGAIHAIYVTRNPDKLTRVN